MQRVLAGLRPLLQHWLTEEDIDGVMAQYDTNGDGVIRYCWLHGTAVAVRYRWLFSECCGASRHFMVSLGWLGWLGCHLHCASVAGAPCLQL